MVNFFFFVYIFPETTILAELKILLENAVSHDSSLVAW